MITFKFRETPELIKMGNPEPNPVFSKQKFKKRKKKKRIGAETQWKLF
ncbi:hypothetical protein KH5H1_78740 [Corallococcus caeni]|uniref:Uncharacterized protein n=1 Tax=Corallococcus caeni TaxID=3082388 RepID=A0ABQ6R5W3_9BACT|nr:hypothetical protein KH5H1_78740 [Corallococcus sp. KH5-1]GMU11564.1 hypothetical protein ASNO1_78180 [Corallococcus sp. NO1]